MVYKDPELGRARSRERFRRRTAERVAEGQCPRCGERPPAAGHGVCEFCAGKRRIADRARAARRRTAGVKRVRDPKVRAAEYARARQRAAERLERDLCAGCGQAPPEPARHLCVTCGEKRRAAERAAYARGKAAGRPYGGRNADSKRRQARAMDRKRQQARRVSGRCIRCGDPLPVDGGASCESCLEARRAFERQTYAARRAAGLCGRCGNPTFEGAARCGPCAVFEDGHQDRKNAANRRRYALRRARGLCTHCGRRPAAGASRCEPCAKRAYERSEHVRGLPLYPPSYTVIERATDIDHGTWDSWEDVALCLAFARLSLDEVEVIIDQSPMQTLTGFS
ncbi:hypothetical protein [Candidatus Rariloculus sp.]|uniref:hypothetical protein n=1 Tax=Candidatus Rariloculus sp. TaxID=3101265 RepID=UPI003D0ED1F3